MRGNKFEKSLIHILKSETLRRLSRVTESIQEIVDSIPYICELYTYVSHMSTLIYFWWRGLLYKNWVGCEEEQSFWKLYIQWVFGTDFMLSLRKLPHNNLL